MNILHLEKCLIQVSSKLFQDGKISCLGIGGHDLTVKCLPRVYVLLNAWGSAVLGGSRIFKRLVIGEEDVLLKFIPGPYSCPCFQFTMR